MALDAVRSSLIAPGPDGLVPPRRGPGIVQAYPGLALLPMQLFSDVVVVPSRAMQRGSGIPDGGPVWPDFARQTLARHCRNGNPADVIPARKDRPVRTLTGSTVWGGVARHHFGHFLAEFSTRLLQSVRERPGDRFLFQTDPLHPDKEPPGYFWSVLDWYGVPREQVAFVGRPMLVKQLRVAAQGEGLTEFPPSPAYLDLVERNAARHALVPVPNEILYVGRPKLCGLGQGGHAAEEYLIERLTALGVAVLDPATEDLRRQLALYAGARTLVFAEGSAMHGRQLLGRIPGQRVVVLVRRPGLRLVRAQLQPRVGDLQYAEVTGNFGQTFRVSGPHTPVGFSCYDVAMLHATFADLGVPLASVWDRAAYEAARDRDVIDWMRVRLAPGANYVPGRTLRHLRQVFAAEGLKHLPILIGETTQPAGDPEGQGSIPWSN